MYFPLGTISFAWLELVSHRSFMPKMLAGNGQKGWPYIQRLLVDLFQFMEPFLRNAELGAPVCILICWISLSAEVYHKLITHIIYCLLYSCRFISYIKVPLGCYLCCSMISLSSFVIITSLSVMLFPQVAFKCEISYSVHFPVT